MTCFGSGLARCSCWQPAAAIITWSATPPELKLYYTTKIDTTDAGAIKIKDEKTGAEVTLQSSEVKEISQDEYEAGLKGQPPKR